ncbi:PAS domain S-box protein [Halobacteriales archaeon Cl-PHB]
MTDATGNHATSTRGGGTDISVVHLDPDETIRSAVTATLEATGGFSVRGVATGEAAIEALESGADCLVSDVSFPGDWAVVAEAAADAPVVLYTVADATEIPSDVLGRADSLVEQGNGEEGRQFLVEKLRGITSDDLREKDRSAAGTAAVEAAAATVPGLFLVEDGTVVWASRPLEEVFPVDAVDGTVPATDDLHERLRGLLADRPRTLQRLTAVMEADEPCDGQLIRLRVGDEPRDYVHRSYPLPAGMTGDRLEVFEDATGRRQNEERRRLLESLVNGANDGLYTLDANGRIDFANPAMAEQLGYTTDEIVGMHAGEVMAEGELEQGQQMIQTLIEDPDTESLVHDMTFRTKAGKDIVVSLHVTLLTGPDGSFAGLMGVMRDVTERTRRERDLERFETIIQAVGDPVYATDADGELIYVNEAFEERTGFDAETVLGDPISVVLDHEDVETARDLISDLLDHPEEADATAELDIHTRDGTTYPAEVHMALLPSDDGYRGNAGVIRDITDRKRREQRLEEFTSVVAHDLRNPLTVGRGSLELYRETGDPDRLETVAGAFDQMERLVEDLLELAQVGEVIGDTSTVDLADNVEEAWDRVPTADATLRCHVEDLAVRADPERLGQLLENLLKNAVEHGGEDVTVTVEATADGFSVGDDGPGIPADQRDAVFDRGLTTASDGSGFGLAIVRAIADAHGWDVTVEDSDAGGARFLVSDIERR